MEGVTCPTTGWNVQVIRPVGSSQRRDEIRLELRIHRVCALRQPGLLRQTAQWAPLNRTVVYRCRAYGTAVAVGDASDRRVASTDPVRINANPARCHPVTGSFNTSTPAISATAGLT